jgi:hypothetical protein
MKMRFTDIEKWRKLWFRDLCPEAKLLLLYLFDNCGDAGVIEKDPTRFAFDTGLEKDEVNTAMTELIGQEKLRHLDSRFLLLPSFVKFQYPKGLKRDYNPHKSAWREIEKHELNLLELGINPSLEQALSKPTKVKVRIKVKDKDKVKIRIKDIWLKAVGGEISPRLSMDSARLETINRYLEKYSLLQLVRVWQQAGRSNFLTNRKGSNRNGWQANFDWMHKPTNWRKIIEGEYDNRERKIVHGF